MNPVLATDSNFGSRLWQMSEGLPNNIVQAIAQTRDGYIWIGTREGLARFDGISFQAVALTPAIAHSSILSLMADDHGGLWIGAENVGLFHLLDGHIQRCSIADEPREFTAYQILDDCRGSIWVASSVGVLKGEGDAFKIVREFRNGLESLCVDQAGEIIFGGNGVRKIEGPTPANYEPRSGKLPREARAMHCDRNGTLWIGALNGLAEARDGVATFFKKGEGPSGFISVILRDREGNLWIGSYAGLSRFTDGRFVSESDPDEPTYRIYVIFEDHEGTLWVGSEEGLTRLTPKRFKTITKKQGLTLNSVVTVCPSRDGSIWISPWGGGLNHIVGDRISVLAKSNGLSSDFVMAMLEARDGSLWAGTDYGSTLNRIKDGNIAYYGRNEGFVASATTVLLEDARGTLWAGTREGLYSLRDGKFSRFTTREGLNHNKINALWEGSDGTIWVGTEAGLNALKQGRFEDLSARDPQLKAIIFSLYEDPEHVLWIGTKDAGILRYKNRTAFAFTEKQGLFSQSIYSILQDARTNLWLNSSKGIFRLEKRQLDAVAEGREPSVTSITYGKSDGIISSGQYRDVTQPTACKGTDGRLWFRTTQGVVVVDPEQISFNDLPPPVVIQEIMVDKKTLGLQPAMGPGSRPVAADAGEPLVIPPGRGELEIRYAALSFLSPEKNQFKYKLEGADPVWVDAGPRHAAYYNNLRPGKYRFQVTACNNDGVWNKSGTSIALILRPHFWQTWWFLLLTIILSVGTVGGTARYATRKKMQHNLRMMEQQNAVERERTRIARDIHDDLGARLTKISMLTELAEREAQPDSGMAGYLRNIYGTAREMLTQLDETVWAVNPRNDRLDQLADYIMHYAEEFFRHTNMRCRLKIAGDIPPLPIPAEPRHHIFLTVKEILNNAARHSEATEVQIRSQFLGGVFTIVVKDNGRGFDAAECLARGRGLQNMKARAAALGGRFELQTEPGQGTEITLAFSVASPHPAGLSPVS